MAVLWVLLTGLADASDTIRVGVAGAHSGDLASYGLPTVAAVQFVVDEVNAAGGIKGKKIEMIKMDDACKPEMATDPGAFYLNAYAASLALVNALNKADSASINDVANTLRAEWVETPLGTISFDENGDAKGIGFEMYQVRNGKYEAVK
jgi:ABC-type branched-subunit amino acid transport system substrate-binding protein